MKPQGPVYHPECFETIYNLPSGATRTHTVRVTMSSVDYSVLDGAITVPCCASCGRPIIYGGRYTSETLMGGWSGQDVRP